jgi:hypothetical protein
MSKPAKQRLKHKPSAAKPQRRLPGVAALVLGLVVVAALGLWAWKRQRPSDSSSAALSAETNAINSSAAGVGSQSGFQKLSGRWRRPDGGYILEIRSVAPDGKMEAGYFNPRPINVAKAAASQEGASVKVFIELRDLNYPGSTYTLTYDPTNDLLQGDYFQAALKQTFDVVFTRTQP